MRKDVKFGLAVGGILLAVLVAYVLFVPPTDTTTVSLNPGDNTPAPNIKDPNPNPAVNVVGPATKPAEPVAPAPAVTETPAPATTDVWGSLLAQGPRPGIDPFRDTRATTPPATDSGAEVLTSLAPATRPAPTSEREHKVQKGETLTSISTAAYGKPDYWPQIAKANPKVDAKHLKIGTTLVLPKIEPETPRIVVPVVTPAVTPAPATPSPANTHKVKKGDTLYTISAEHFGTTQKWDKIYELNKVAIGADPAKLKIDMVLKLPERDAAASTASKH